MIFLTNRYFNFQQSWFISVITLVAIILFTRLGFWQINRAEEKQSLAETIEQRAKQPTIIINRENLHILQDSALNHQKVQIQGQYDQHHLFFLDNKKHQGKAGFEVITPFKIDNSQTVLLVNRGWVAARFNRNNLPEVTTPSSTITLIGRVSEPPKQRFRPGIEHPSEQLGGIWLYLDTQYFTHLSKVPVYPVVLLLDSKSPSGFVRHWPEFKANPGMHVSYALQWFAFALFALLTYIWFGLNKVSGNEQK